MQTNATLALNTELLSRELAELDRVLHRMQAHLSPAKKSKAPDVARVLRRTAGRIPPARANAMLRDAHASRRGWDAREETLAALWADKKP